MRGIGGKRRYTINKNFVMKPFYKTNIAWDVKDEWIAKEEGSWEDHDKPSTGHIHPLLTSMPQDKIICNTQEDAQLVYNSAIHQLWDSGDPLVKRLERKAANICKQLKPILETA